MDERKETQMASPPVLLTPFDDNEPRYLKAGTFGMQGSGKSFTMLELLLAVWRMFELKKPEKERSPITLFDTEDALKYLRRRIVQVTGMEPLQKRSRSFRDLRGVTREVDSRRLRYFMLDSATHMWRALCDAFLESLNAKRREKGQPPLARIPMWGWQIVKRRWAEFADWFNYSPVHCGVAGRAGYEFDENTDEDTNEKNLVKTGVKMKSEGEFGYESTLLFYMAQEQDTSRGGIRVVRSLTVLKDRTVLLDGMAARFPGRVLTDGDKQHVLTPEEHDKLGAAVARFFAPHLRDLNPLDVETLRPNTGEDFELDDIGRDDWAREKMMRQVLWEEIEGEFVRAGISGTGKVETQKRTELLGDIFGTTSKTLLSEETKSDALREGLGRIRGQLRPEEFDHSGRPRRHSPVAVDHSLAS
jgi:hypothetical protein